METYLDITTFALSSSVSTWIAADSTIIRLVLDARFRSGADSSDAGRNRLRNRSEFPDEPPVLEDSGGESTELGDFDRDPKAGMARSFVLPPPAG